jgi:N-methylhydantoinase A
LTTTEHQTDAAGAFLGVDVGGTFTDLVFYTPEGALHCVKVPSTPATPGVSTLNGIDEIRAALAIDGDTWRHLHHTHSSTVATNALIERRGATIGMLTTEGFRDLFELQRLAIPHPMRFDSRRPAPLVRRALVGEVVERTDAQGRELTPLDRDSVVRAATRLRDAGCEIVVICFLHSYRNPEHERQARGVIRSEVPGLRVELSSEVWPQAREYERATLTAVNAYIRPTVETYLDQLLAGLGERGIETPARAARSNGGMELAATMRGRPVVALLSGPAAGVTGAAAAALDAGWAAADLMTVDVGGTSADIGVIRQGRPVLSSEEHVADFPMLIPTIAVSSIGAGGGSEIWLDETASLKVGPRSVGADPGPACYGVRDAGIAALTDAFLVAGLLAPGQRLGGKLALRPEPAERALARLGERIGWDVPQVADGAIQVAIALMAAEATNVLARRGVDVPDFRMVAFGGAGPAIAALLAEEIYIDEVLVPPTPGALSALGAARADLEGDLVRPVYQLIDEAEPAALGRALDDLVGQVDAWIAEETRTLAVGGTVVEVAADMRYDGQGYDVTVPLQVEWLRTGDREAIAAAFHEAHRATFGHRNDEARIWLKELRAHVIGRVAKPSVAPLVERGPAAPAGAREIRLRGERMTASVHRREDVRVGQVVEGPAIVEQMDTTTLVPPGWDGRVVGSGAMVLRRRENGR